MRRPRTVGIEHLVESVAAECGVLEPDFRNRYEEKATYSSVEFPSSSIPQARHRLHHVLALLAEQKNRYYLVVSDRANADVTTHMQLHAVDGRARDPGGSPFACESGCARPRERRAAGARPDQERGRH